MPESGRPNILVIWGDDIGISNLSCYSDGLMGYRTPNIDRLADEGMLLTDCYGEQSCTAGRSSFITGQSVYRTGLSKVGVPGSPIGLQAEDPTIAELLKPLGYATGQFGKNHLGDLNEFLPTVHGFDEFFGNLYHLNAEEEPELADYPPPTISRTSESASARAACSTAGRPTPTIRPSSPPGDGRQAAHRGHRPAHEEAHGDDRRRVRRRCRATSSGASTTAGKPVLRVGQHHAHALPDPHQAREPGQAGRWQSPYHDTMLDHDEHVGRLLDLLDELGSPTTRSLCTRPTTGRT